MAMEKITDETIDIEFVEAKFDAAIPRGMRIYVDVGLTDERITLEVDSWNTVDDVKVKIQEEYGLRSSLCPKEEQRLIFAGKSMKNSRTLADYNIQMDCILLFMSNELSAMQIFVKSLDGKMTVINVNRTDTIKDVKTKIHEMEGTLVNSQKLVFSGKLLEDSHKLHSYEIEDESILQLVVRREGEKHVFLKSLFSWMTMSVLVGSPHTVNQLKAMIEAKYPIKPDRYRLYFAGRLLEEGHSLMEYEIEEDSVIDALPKASV